MRALHLVALGFLALTISSCSAPSLELATTHTNDVESVQINARSFENRFLDAEIERLKMLPNEQEELSDWLEVRTKCESSDGLRSIVTKVDNNDEKTEKVRYYYEYFRGKRSNAPLIVYIPGGPGLGSIGGGEFSEFLDDYDVIHIDIHILLK